MKNKTRPCQENPSTRQTHVKFKCEELVPPGKIAVWKSITCDHKKQKTMATTSSPKLVADEASRKTHQLQKALPRESKHQTNPCWVLMWKFSPNRTKWQQYDSPQHAIPPKKSHGDGIKKSTRNHKIPATHTLALTLTNNLYNPSSRNLQEVPKEAPK